MPITYKPVSQAQIIQETIEAREKAATKKEKDKRLSEAAMVKSNALKENALRARDKYLDTPNKRVNFIEQCHTALLETAIFEAFSSAMKKANEKLNRSITEDAETTMHALIYSFIHENGGASMLLNKMRTRCNGYMGDINNIIKESMNAIIESIDNTDSSTFHINNEIMSCYRDEAKRICEDGTTDIVADRVADAVEQFIAQNINDKQSIVTVLTATKEKIDSLDPSTDDAIKESYAQIGRKYINDVRNKPKTLFAEMVNTMAKGVVSNDNLKEEYLEGGHINVGKIIDKMALMYGFLETVNLLKLVKVDESYIKNMLNDMK